MVHLFHIYLELCVLKYFHILYQSFTHLKLNYIHHTHPPPHRPSMPHIHPIPASNPTRTLQPHICSNKSNKSITKQNNNKNNSNNNSNNNNNNNNNNNG